MLEQKFGGYAVDVDHVSITRWLEQFDNDQDRTLGLKLLDYVNYYGPARLRREVQILHEQVQRADPEFDIYNSYFIGFGFAGHGSDYVLERYRFANGYTGDEYEDRFRVLAELERLPIEPFTRFYFVDDFVGTGDATLKVWEKIRDFLPKTEENARHFYLLLLASHEEGKKRIENETPLQIITTKLIFENQKILSPDNAYFKTEERRRIRDYCKRAATGKAPAFGYGSCQSNVIFHYRAPDNVISVLVSANGWKGLFLRDF